MRAKVSIKDYLSFGKKDRVGVVVLVSLIGIIFVLPYLFSKKSEPFPAREASIFIKAADTLSTNENSKFHEDYENNDNFRYQPSVAKSFENCELFRFDPNTLSVEGWQRLGLSERTSRTIDKYRSKGGKFSRREDIQRIYGLPTGFYERVKDYIIIAPAENNYSRSDFYKVYTRPEKKALVVDINEADTSAFIDLPGIGSKLAARIVNFRDKLGGFYSVDQVAETYGLPDSTFQKIKGSLQLSGSVKKLNINTATKEELKVHPYLRWNLANAIVEYRNQHGTFKSLDDLKNIALVDEPTFEKIVHYLSL